jgi:putative ABC transport system permease protein
MESLIHDLRYGAKMLIGRPGFSILAILVIAIGIGANSAIFSVTNSVLLRPLPYKDSERIVALWSNLHRENLEQVGASVPEFVDFTEQSQSFDQVAGYTWKGFNLAGDDQPARGRTFTAEEDQPGADQVVVISDKLWKRRFGADPDIVGKTIRLDNRSFTIIGVMPVGFQFPYDNISVWKPISFSPEDKSNDERGSHFLEVIARLKPGVTIERAQSEMDQIAAGIADKHPNFYGKGLSLCTSKQSAKCDLLFWFCSRRSALCC